MATTTQEEHSAVTEGSVEQEYIVQSGDDLAKIAEVYYGSQEHWSKVHTANLSLIGPNPHELEIGMVLAIPPL